MTVKEAVRTLGGQTPPTAAAEKKTAIQPAGTELPPERQNELLEKTVSFYEKTVFGYSPYRFLKRSIFSMNYSPESRRDIETQVKPLLKFCQTGKE